MSERLNLLPDETFVGLRPNLEARLQLAARAVTPGNFMDLIDSSTEALLRQTFKVIGADEGSVWLVESGQTGLVVAYNSGPQSSSIVGFRQPLSEGIVSMVLATQMPFAESEIYRNARHSKLLDDRLHLTTYAMVAAPFYFMNACRGVITAVQLVHARSLDGMLILEGEAPPGFGPSALDGLRHAAAILSTVVDHRLLTATLGWNQH
jgi:hypothetical protein